MSSWQNCSSTGLLDEQLAAHVADRLAQDIASNGAASLAVSGGSTPKGFFQHLSNADIDWARVFVTLVDERWVNNDSPDSNERLVYEHLLQNKATGAQFIGLKTAHDNGEDGLGETRLRLTEVPRPFSAVILGMGGDGHTASWFPEADNLSELLDPDNEWDVAPTHPVTAPHQRMTLTFPAVLNSREIILHITGEDKRAVLESAEQTGVPVSEILRQTTTPVTIWWAPL